MARNGNWRGPIRVRGSGNAERADGRLSPAILFLPGLFFSDATDAARSLSCWSRDERLSG